MAKASTVLIYGTNLSGYRIAYALGKMGYKTIMLNRGAYVDEVRNQVLSQLPFDLCWACAYAPQRLFVGLGALQMYYNSELIDVKGEPGNFKVKIKKKDAFVNNYICTECEKCVDICPVEFEDNGEKQKAIKVLPKMFWENIFLIDEENCTQCGQCEEVCPTGALKINRQEEELELEIGAIILAPEFDEPGIKELKPFGWQILSNVVKSSDIARASLASNFTEDSFRRPSDGKLPQSIAVIVTPQFNKDKTEYETYNASAQAVYRANKIKDIHPSIDVSLFCREYKCYGKGHCRMYQRAQDGGVNIIRTETIHVSDAGDGNNKIFFSSMEIQNGGAENTSSQNNGTQNEKIVDMVVLITGQAPPSAMEKLSDICGVEAEEHGFCKLLPFTCAKTNMKGIFGVGEFTAPKGNPETIWEGYGPLREIISCLGEKNFAKPSPPVLRDVSYEKVKTGVFICSCFGAFSNKMDLEALVKRVENSPYVAHAEIINGCCTPPSIQETAARIKESGVNRVVLAVCTPTQKMMKFRKTVMIAGLNPLLSEFLRLREDIIQVHSNPAKMENKAFSMICAAAAKLKTAKAMPTLMDSIGSKVLIIGGGPAGLEAARYLGDAGHNVQVVEKKDHVGGMTDVLLKDLEGHDFKGYMDQLLDDIEKNEQVTIHTNTTVKTVSGYAGNFHVQLETNGLAPFNINPAIVIIATGAVESKPDLYQYGRNGRIMTQLEFEQKLTNGEISGSHVAMIQCVGSRNLKKPYCSRVCCSAAIKNALKLRGMGIDVTILYRDMNTYGFKDDYFQMAKEKGVKFIRFDEKQYPELKISGDITTSGNGAVPVNADTSCNAKASKDVNAVDASTEEAAPKAMLKIITQDITGKSEKKDDTAQAGKTEGKNIEISADYLVLSTGMEPDGKNAETLSNMFSLKLDEDGFFDVESCACPYEDASKRIMKPFELSSNGVFVVGSAHSPRAFMESVMMARQAAGKAMVILSSAKMPPPNAMYVSEVDLSKCTGCGICVDVCPYNARDIDPVRKVATVHPFLCDSCGACVVACPSSAAFLRDQREDQLIRSIDALLAV